MSDVTDRTPGRSVLRTGHTNADSLHSFWSLNGFISVERTFDDVLQRSKKKKKATRKGMDYGVPNLFLIHND